nr:TolC family protein [uncultured Flavobacterium sp.]
MRNAFIILLLIGFLPKIEAQEKTQNFTLQQAIEHAVQNNYTSINAGRDIEAAKKKKWETTTIGLPQIDGTVSYLNNFKIATNQIIIDGQPVTLQFGNYNTMDAGVKLSQLIFNGSYLVGLESAKTYLKISENAKLKTNQEVKEITIQSYGNVLLAEETIKILEKNKGILEKTTNDTQQIFKNGLIEEENVEQLQITLASVNSSLDYAKRMKTIATNMLKLVMGIPLEQEIILTEKLDTLTEQNIDLALLQRQFDVKNNIDYQIGENVTESKRLLVKYEKSKALPSLGANVNFGYNTFGNRFTMFDSDQQWYNYSNLGVALNIPIFSSLGRSSRTQQAKIAYDQAKTNLTETEQKLQLEYQKAKSDYEYSIEQLATSKNTLRLAERIEGKQQVKFKEGLSTSFDFTEAQRQLYTAQQSYLEAMINVINKKALLEKISNNQ